MLETIVSKEDIAKNYLYGLEDLLNYEKAMQLIEKHSACEIAGILHLKKTRMVAWFNDRADTGKTSRPFSVRCVDYLEEKGLLPMSAENPHFREINILTSWLMWSGHVRIGEQVSFSTALPKTELNGRKDSRLKTVEECLCTLQIPFEYRLGELRTMEHGWLSRLFYCMGVPNGSKQKNLPNLSYLDSCEMQGRYDFIKVLFSTKLSGSRKYGYLLNLISNPKRNLATKHLHETTEVLNSFFSDFDFMYRVEKRKVFGNYIFFTPRAYISKNEFNKVMEKHPDLMEFSR